MYIGLKKDLRGNVAFVLVIVLVVSVAIGGYLVYKKSSKSVSIQQNSTTNSDNKEVATANSTQKKLDLDKLPLGDNKYSLVKPSKGYIYSCVRVGGGGGAFKDGPWIDSANGTWSKKNKNVSVSGSVNWPTARFQVSDKADTRELSGNGLPTNHGTGTFPVSRNDDAFDYDRNPNSIQAQKILESIALNPSASTKSRCLNMGPVGYSINGVAIFNALDGEGRDAAAHEILDNCGGHPERTGQYHYHDYSACMADKSTEPKLIGYMLDGFGLYKYPDNPKNDDLDECHGKIGEVTWNGQKQSIYHYVITDEYPYTIGCFKGN